MRRPAESGKLGVAIISVDASELSVSASLAVGAELAEAAGALACGEGSSSEDISGVDVPPDPTVSLAVWAPPHPDSTNSDVTTASSRRTLHHFLSSLDDDRSVAQVPAPCAHGGVVPVEPARPLGHRPARPTRSGVSWHVPPASSAT
jgi:hypothetical protein